MVVCFNQKVIDDEMIDLKVKNRNAGFKFFPQFLLTLSLLTKLADLNVHKIKTDGRQKWTFLQPHTNFFLILRRNEAERKHSATQRRKSKNYNTLFQFGMHATKGSTNFSISTPKHLILYFTLPFLSFCIFFLFFPRLRNRASTGLGQRQVTLYVLFFLYVLA
jgi:hypothetical protein